jgi:hypothetical protein
VDGIRKAYTLGFMPVEEAYQTLNAVTNIRKGPKEWLQGLLGARMNPVLGTFLDYMYDKNSFTRGEFGTYLPERYTRIIPDKAAKLMGLTPGTRAKYEGGKVVGEEKCFYGDPDAIFRILRIPVTSRILNDLANLAQSMATGKTKAGIMRYTLGVRTVDVDVDRAKALEGYRRDRVVEKMATAQGAKIYRRPYIPPEQKKRKKP